MKTILRSSALACVAVGVLMAGSPSWSQGDRMTCDGKQQDRAACLREAGAARQEAQRGGLSNAGPGVENQNALSRCKLQPPADRADCEARVKGTGQTSTEGSVMGGGVIRETVTPVPATGR
ncbi:hypothetical protein [Variovorax sp. PvP013]|jgi:hypothetical protein|uniref:hypothetical protein n=1 Tax=Variovorax sp. PvP013 TaxID=3156435 RepID=UPI003D24477C